jgi:hypothetical protein
MAKRSAKQLDQIIRTQLPGYHLARRSAHVSGAAGSDAAPNRRSVEPDAATPSIAQLRRKYLGSRARADSDAAGLAPASSAEDEADIVNIEPDGIDDEVRRHTKAVVISADGKILGYQG